VNATSVPEGSSIDPRIRARRVEVIRTQGRRRLRILLAVVCTMCVAGFAWLVVESPLLDVDRVEVVGAKHVSVAGVLAAAHVEHGSALLTLDRGSVAGRVDRMPWVARADVSKHLPGTVRIQIVERVPVAWTNVGAAAPGRPPVALVDATGRVLADVAAPPAGLPELAGLGAVPAPGHRIGHGLLAIEQGLPAELRAMVAGLVATPSGFTLLLAPGTPAGELRIGSGAQLTAKTDAALAVLRSLGTNHVPYVDVSVPTAPVTG
jgi:cell division protein FtsQ